MSKESHAPSPLCRDVRDATSTEDPQVDGWWGGWQKLVGTTNTTLAFTLRVKIDRRRLATHIDPARERRRRRGTQGA
jgi:hypothetical protein